MQAIRTGLIFFFLLASLSALYSQQVKTSLDKVIAVVGDRIILQSEIKNSIEDAKRQRQELPEDAECLYIEQAVVWKMLALQADKDSIIVTDEEVEQQLDHRLRSLLLEVGSREAFQTYYGKSIEQFKEDQKAFMRESILVDAMKQRITSNVTITPAEVKAFFEKIPQQSLPLMPATVEVAQIISYPKAARDIEQYTIAELNNYKRQLQSRVATFEQLAQRYSQDSASRERGGRYLINRNETGWDPSFMKVVFQLRAGEISTPVKSQMGFHLIKVEERNGDEAAIRHILRIPPITDADISVVKAKMDTVRWKIIAGTISFNDAFKKYGEGEREKMTGPDIINHDGSTFVSLDQLDAEMASIIKTMKPGEYSAPQVFTDGQGKKAVRIVLLKSFSPTHRLNLRDDYVTLSQLAKEQKQNDIVQKWVLAKVPTFYIQIEPAIAEKCKQLGRFASSE